SLHRSSAMPWKRSSRSRATKLESKFVFCSIKTTQARSPSFMFRITARGWIPPCEHARWTLSSARAAPIARALASSSRGAECSARNGFTKTRRLARVQSIDELAARRHFRARGEFVELLSGAQDRRRRLTTSPVFGCGPVHGCALFELIRRPAIDFRRAKETLLH